MDTLELGSSGGQFHCVLVCLDMFSKWVEVIPLPRHDGASVAEAFLKICLRFGAPRVVRSDNGTEFQNAIVSTCQSHHTNANKQGGGSSLCNAQRHTGRTPRYFAAYTIKHK